MLQVKKSYKVKWVQNFSTKLSNDLEGVDRGLGQNVSLGFSLAQTAEKVVTFTSPE
jgi:hypothetical protein